MPNYITLNQLINMKLMYNNMLLNSKMLKDLIYQDANSSYKQNMKDGERYFNGLHDILNHVNYYYINETRQVDTIKSNEKLPHPFHQFLVNQKVSYIAGNPIKISSNKPDEENFKQFISAFNDLVGEDFDDVINDLIIGASNKAEEWIHFYINNNGELKFIIADAKELIPIYDSQYNKELVGMIRYYKVENNTIDAETNNIIKQDVYKVEWWTKTDVTYYIEDGNEFVLDYSYETNPSAHWYVYNTFNEKEVTARSWDKVPFIKLQNNSSNTTDLQAIKPLIDAYDLVKSGWLNDIQDFQELILVLKGYSGLITAADRDSGLSFLDLFIKNLKTKKAIPIDEDGSVDSLKNEIPFDARKQFLDLTKKEIFFFGYGINIDQDSFSSAPSGVSLKFLYSLLDLKCNIVIRKLKTTLQQFVNFINIYIKEVSNIEYDTKDITFIINKSMIFNEAEKINSVNASSGIVSERTLLENHPFVEDVEEELKRLAIQRAEEFANNLEQLERQLANTDTTTDAAAAVTNNNNNNNE